MPVVRISGRTDHARDPSPAEGAPARFQLLHGHATCGAQVSGVGHNGLGAILLADLAFGVELGRGSVGEAEYGSVFNRY